jgi:type II secretory pathway pseudopilin PulG
MILLVLLVMGALAYLIGNLAPELNEPRRERQTQEVLAQARDALIGYALRYRESQPDRVYGYLPLPDLGRSRNNNVACTPPNEEGCDAANFAGNAINTTVIGRLPWRTLGIEPLRDANGECLWYAISGSHQRVQATTPMNWDTLSHLDVVVANGSASLVAALASAHQRPVAVIFSPGPPLASQNRGNLGGDDVTQCGGNYDVRNYLDPHTAGALGVVTNYLANVNNAYAVTDPNTPKALSPQGRIFSSGGNLLPKACEAADCTLLANDSGLALTGDQLFGAIRKHALFRTDINAMLDRMVNCLRDKFVAGGFAPAAIGGYTPPADKLAGHLPFDACYDGTKVPLAYYDSYQELLFVAKPSGAGTFTVNSDAGCAGTLVFAGQRGAGQQRVSAADRSALTNYLEGNNLASFTNPGTTFGSVGGPTLLDRVPLQTPEQDIARCIPAGASFSTVASPALGANQLAAYDAATHILTLGRLDITTGFGYNANTLFGCGWFAEQRLLAGGLRSYFRFQFKQLGTSVGGNGFVFALVDALRNSLNVCGAGGSHLGYSGDNGSTAKIRYPKIGVEFDQSRNSGFSEFADLSLGNPGRNDPCGTSSCGGTIGYNSHAALVYWGHESANGTDGVTRPDDDNNVHGYPTAGSLAGTRRPPRSHRDPATESGIKFVNLRGNPVDSSLYHVRVELTPVRTTNADALLSKTAIALQVWIADDASTSADRIAALKNTTRPMSLLDPTFAPTLTDTPDLFDVQEAACVSGVCPTGQACGSDNMCYRPALERIQLGFTNSQRTSDQQVDIIDFFTTWLP